MSDNKKRPEEDDEDDEEIGDEELDEELNLPDVLRGISNEEKRSLLDFKNTHNERDWEEEILRRSDLLARKVDMERLKRMAGTTTSTTKKKSGRKGRSQEEEEEEEEETAPKRKVTTKAKTAATKGKGGRGKMTVDSEDDDDDDDDEEEDKDGVDDEDEDDDDDDEEGGFFDTVDMNRDEIQKYANKVMAQCDGVSKNLRLSLVQWETGADASDCRNMMKTPVMANGKNKGSAGRALADRDCVDLTTIKECTASSATNYHGQSSALISEGSLGGICPELLLKSYQLVGINWLKLLHENNVNGVLADDMGLGKTIQSIAFLAWLHTQAQPAGSGRKPHLIVVPASTLSNWQNELQRFCPTLNVMTYHGSQNERTELRYAVKCGHSNPHIILSTYTIFERESCHDDRRFMYKMAFDYLILDEAHCIKNAAGSRFINLNYLRTRHRLLLSGTPVQNDISELLSMLSFLMPKVFSRSKRELLIEAFDLSNKTRSSSSSGTAAQKQQQLADRSVKQLRSMLAPFVLRRLKRDVLDQLTGKTTVVKKLPLTPFQKEVYDNILLGHANRKDLIKLQVQADLEKDRLLDGHKRSSKNNTRADAGAGATSSSSSSSSSSVGAQEGAADIGGSGGEALIDLTSPTSVTALGTDPAAQDVFAKENVAHSSSASEAAVNPGTSQDSGQSRSTTSNHSSSDSTAATSITGLTTTATSVCSAAPAAGTVAASTALIATTTATTSTSTSTSNMSTTNSTAVAELPPMSTSEANHLFTALRKAANHPLLLRVRYKDPAVLDKIAQIAYHAEHFGRQCDYQRARDEVDQLSDFDIHQMCLEYPSLQYLRLDATVLYDSPKMNLLRDLLPQLQAQGHRMLVFSQWTRLLDLLEVLMQDIEFNYLRLDGTTPVKQRQELIDKFNGDTSIPVFLLSTKAGGLGINLTAADTVILHDLDFNPENDRQAEDRCHRIGQTKPVTVYKLLAEDCVDEDIFEMGERKSKLSKAVLADERSPPLLQQQGEGGEGGAAAGRSSSKGGKGRGKGTAESGGDGSSSSSAIGNILQRALTKRIQQLSGSSAV